MSLFGSDNPRAEELAAAARGESVTPDILEISSRIVAHGHLLNHSILDLLAEGEQPHYYLYNVTSGFSRDDDSVGGSVNAACRSVCVVTDRRLILFTKGRLGWEIPYGEIIDVAVSHSRLKHRLTLETTDPEYVVYGGRKTIPEEFDEAADYIRMRASNVDPGTDEAGELPEIDPIWGNTADIPDKLVVPDEMLNATPQGAYVTYDRVENIIDCLRDDERVHYMMKGSTVRTEGSASGDNAFGVDPSKTGSAWGNVWIAVTDQRIVVKIERLTKDDGERSIDLDQIIGVDRDSTHTGYRLAIHVPSRTYHLGVVEPGGDEVREVVEFLRSRKSESSNGGDPEASDAADRLRDLQDLHDDGLLTDEEFEAKRSDLVDEL